MHGDDIERNAQRQRLARNSSSKKLNASKQASYKQTQLGRPTKKPKVSYVAGK